MDSRYELSRRAPNEDHGVFRNVLLSTNDLQSF